MNSREILRKRKTLSRQEVLNLIADKELEEELLEEISGMLKTSEGREEVIRFFAEIVEGLMKEGSKRLTEDVKIFKLLGNAGININNPELLTGFIGSVSKKVGNKVLSNPYNISNYLTIISYFCGNIIEEVFNVIEKIGLANDENFVCCLYVKICRFYTNENNVKEINKLRTYLNNLVKIKINHKKISDLINLDPFISQFDNEDIVNLIKDLEKIEEDENTKKILDGVIFMIHIYGYGDENGYIKDGKLIIKEKEFEIIGESEMTNKRLFLKRQNGKYIAEFVYSNDLLNEGKRKLDEDLINFTLNKYKGEKKNLRKKASEYVNINKPNYLQKYEKKRAKEITKERQNFINGINCKFDIKLLKKIEEQFLNSAKNKKEENSERTEMRLFEIFDKSKENTEKHHKQICEKMNLSTTFLDGEFAAKDKIIKTNVRTKGKDRNIEEQKEYYSENISLFLNKFGDKLEKDENGQVRAFISKDWKYVGFKFLKKGMIFISDIVGYSTRFYKEENERFAIEFINGDLSFLDFANIFGPHIEIKRQYGINDFENNEKWINSIQKAINKETQGYYLDGIGNNNKIEILKDLYKNGKIPENSFKNIRSFRYFLNKYNEQIHNSNLTQKEKRIQFIIDNKGKEISISYIIHNLGGKRNILMYQGHGKYIGIYIKYLLESDFEEAKKIEKQIKKNSIIKDYKIKFLEKISKRKISEHEFEKLFSDNKAEASLIRKELKIPRGMHTEISWIIALGEDPDDAEKLNKSLRKHLKDILFNKKYLIQ